MILDLVYVVVRAVADLVFALLPDWTPFDFTGTGVGSGGGGDPFWTLGVGGAWLNQYLPLSESVTLLSLLMTLYGASVAYKGAVWLLTKLRILGGSSD